MAISIPEIKDQITKHSGEIGAENTKNAMLYASKAEEAERSGDIKKVRNYLVLCFLTIARHTFKPETPAERLRNEVEDRVDEIDRLLKGLEEEQPKTRRRRKTA